MRRVLALLLALLPLAAAAQEAPATLIADRVAVEGNDRLRAAGNVEVFYDGIKLQATSILYDAETDRLTIEGPLTVVTPDGSFLLADSAAIAPDLSNGILRSARLVLDQQLQLAANVLLRLDGRYSVLGKTVASSCSVCAGEVPLWRIRAARIVHDEWERQLYFDHARLEVMGLPVFYLPRLRLPDPTLKRTNGFLTPQVRVTDGLGTGLKLPYFVTLGRHADLTVTPYLSTGHTRTLELRYRQAFRTGEVELNGALSRDDLLKGEIRRYVFAEGRFDLPRDFTLEFDIKSVSDPAYLLDYGYSDDDRLISTLEVARTRRDEYIGAGLAYVNSLRASESNQTLPTTIANITWQRRFAPPALGGLAEAGLEFYGFNRRSGEDVIGRDVARVSADLDWRRSWAGAQGLVFTTQTAFRLDYYAISDDSTVPSSETRFAPFAAAELRWPLVRAGTGGVTQVLEPVAQLVWSPNDSSDIVNEDSRSAEFDEGNLFALGRFPGVDAYEDGLRANLGLSWTRHDPAGWSLAVAGGRIFRQENDNQFSAGSGLDGVDSDWLLAVQLATAENLSVTNRALFDDGLSFTRNELRLDWTTSKLDLASSFVWQEANLLEDRPDDSSEVVVDAAYDFRRDWTGKVNWRYDFAESSAQKAGVGLQYRGECVTVDLSLSRRFTSSTSVRPETDFGLSVSLAGFGGTGDARSARRSCLR